MKKKIKITYEDRINIQAGIAKGLSLNQIARIIGKDKSSIYRELKVNSYTKKGFETCPNCLHKCGSLTRKENFKDKKCHFFEPSICNRWSKFPYTCNECPKGRYCRHEKRYYDCLEADRKASKIRHQSRSRKLVSKGDIETIDKIVTPGVLKGQSLHHIYYANPALQNICCERTIRRYLYNDYLTVRAHQLPRYVRYKREYNYSHRSKIKNIERCLGRTYTDFLKYKNDHPNKNFWEYDSVIGRRTDKKAILTITFPKYRFQFGLLIRKGVSSSVNRKMRLLQELFGDKFKEIFQVNLSDNGTEFDCFHEIEKVQNDEDGEILCRVFFTNPYKSTDKARCERNHEFIRYVLPKGESLDFLTQEKVNLLFSHINSYIRESNDNKSPYQLMVEAFGIEFMNAIGINEISANEVLLKPELLH